ncbi:hypothetical protein ACDX78_02145 [Virgibacillus oceani]
MRFYLDDQMVLETTSDKHDFLKDRELEMGDVIQMGDEKVMIESYKEQHPHNIIDYYLIRME